MIRIFSRQALKVEVRKMKKKKKKKCCADSLLSVWPRLERLHTAVPERSTVKQKRRPTYIHGTTTLTHTMYAVGSV